MPETGPFRYMPFRFERKQFIYENKHAIGINEDIAGCWDKRAQNASKPYTGHRHTLIYYVRIHKHGKK